MCHGRECARLGSSTRLVSFYTSLVGGGLRLSGSSSGRNGSVRVYRSVIRTLCSLSEVWVGGRRGAGSGSDWGEHLSTTGPGPHTTLNLTHFRNSLGRMTS